MNIPAAVWFEELPSTPSEFRGPGLDFNLVPTDGPQGPTVALTGKYRVGPLHQNYYGGQLPAPIWIVAVDTTSGRAWFDQCLLPDDPVVMVRATDQEAAHVPEPLVHESGYFNVDMAAHLRLPPDGADYHVFAWLDEHVSTLQPMHLDKNPRRVPFRNGAGMAPELAFEFGATNASPPAPAEGMSLAFDPVSRLVHGTLPADADPYTATTVLAFGHRTRNAGSADFTGDALAPGTDFRHFRFDPARLTGAPAPDQKIFVVALHGGKLTNVLVVRSE